MTNKFFALILIFVFFTSCVSRKKIAYFQNISSIENSASVNYQPHLKADDVLLIFVSAENMEAAAAYNLPIVGTTGFTSNTMDIANAQMRYQTYLIDNEGYILFPGIGKIKLGGLTRQEALNKLTKELEKYIVDPVVNMRIMNFKISVIGEVMRPGSFNVGSERITLLEALSMAGDLTIYGSRDKVLIIREVDGVKTHNIVDITKADFINSPYYYLTQNDIVYVEPNKTRVNSSAIGPNITVGISALSLLITIISIATR